jgi:hypothetical protein
MAAKAAIAAFLFSQARPAFLKKSSKPVLLLARAAK